MCEKSVLNIFLNQVKYKIMNKETFTSSHVKIAQMSPRECATELSKYFSTGAMYGYSCIVLQNNSCKFKIYIRIEVLGAMVMEYGITRTLDKLFSDYVNDSYL